MTEPPPHPSPWSAAGRHAGKPPPLGAVLVLLALWMALTALGVMPVTMAAHSPFGDLGRAPIPQSLGLVLMLGAIGVFGWRGIGLGRARPGTARLMWLPWLYLPLFALGMLAVGTPPWQALPAVALAMLFVALSEELMFRGLLYAALRQTMGPWAAIWISSALFGAVHLLNALQHGDWRVAATQAVAATGTGLLLIALRLRRGSIWPAVFYHMLWNVAIFGLAISALGTEDPATALAAQSGTDASVLPALLVLPNALYALFLLRHAGRGDLPGDIGRHARPQIEPAP